MMPCLSVAVELSLFLHVLGFIVFFILPGGLSLVNLLDAGQGRGIFEAAFHGFISEPSY